MGYRNYKLMSELEDQLEYDRDAGIITYNEYAIALRKLYRNHRIFDLREGDDVLDDCDDELSYKDYIENTSLGEYA